VSDSPRGRKLSQSAVEARRHRRRRRRIGQPHRARFSAPVHHRARACLRAARRFAVVRAPGLRHGAISAWISLPGSRARSGVGIAATVPAVWRGRSPAPSTRD